MDQFPLMVPLLLALLTSLVTLDLSWRVMLKEFVRKMECGLIWCRIVLVSF